MVEVSRDGFPPGSVFVNDPCRLVRQVKKIPWLERAALSGQTPATSRGRWIRFCGTQARLQFDTCWRFSPSESDSPAGRAGRGLADFERAESNHGISLTMPHKVAGVVANHTMPLYSPCPPLRRLP